MQAVGHGTDAGGRNGDRCGRQGACPGLALSKVARAESLVDAIAGLLPNAFAARPVRCCAPPGKRVDGLFSYTTGHVAGPAAVASCGKRPRLLAAACVWWLPVKVRHGLVLKFVSVLPYMVVTMAAHYKTLAAFAMANADCVS